MAIYQVSSNLRYQQLHGYKNSVAYDTWIDVIFAGHTSNLTWIVKGFSKSTITNI